MWLRKLSFIRHTIFYAHADGLKVFRIFQLTCKGHESVHRDEVGGHYG